jgi:hypothetical protein
MDLDKNFWDKQWQSKQTAWDIGYASTPIVNYFKTLPNKNYNILIVGCGNAYEAEYLLSNGFGNITIIDIAPTVVSQLLLKFEKYIGKELSIIAGDFFMHSGRYDIIIEQTFFCALNPNLRTAYKDKMYELLNKDGIIAGLLFNREFEQNPPFGGSKSEYELLFQEKFLIQKMEECTQSIPQRAGTELWIELIKK